MIFMCIFNTKSWKIRVFVSFICFKKILTSEKVHCNQWMFSLWCFENHCHENLKVKSLWKKFQTKRWIYELKFKILGKIIRKIKYFIWGKAKISLFPKPQVKHFNFCFIHLSWHVIQWPKKCSHFQFNNFVKSRIGVI